MANNINWLASRIKQDENNRLVSDTQITAWNGKADAVTHILNLKLQIFLQVLRILHL